MNDNGLLPSIWGPHMWKSIHCIAFNYPLYPTQEDKNNYKQFFKYLGYVLPCKSCAKSYREITSNLDNNIFKSRNSLVKWTYDLHNTVNKKLNIIYRISFDDFVQKYESFRIVCLPNVEPCIVSNEHCAKSFCNEYVDELPFVPFEIAIKFHDYALSRKFYDFNKIYTHYQSYKNNDKKEWNKRNQECSDIVKYMRQNGIPSLETSGKYKNMPTLLELELLYRLCSNLCIIELQNIYSSRKKYKLIKK